MVVLHSKELSMMDWMIMMHSGRHNVMKMMDIHGDYGQGKGMKGMHDDYDDQGKYNSGW